MQLHINAAVCWGLSLCSVLITQDLQRGDYLHGHSHDYDCDCDAAKWRDNDFNELFVFGVFHSVIPFLFWLLLFGTNPQQGRHRMQLHINAAVCWGLFLAPIN